MDGLTDHLNMTIVVDWDVKNHSNRQSRLTKASFLASVQKNLKQSGSLVMFISSTAN